MRFKPVPLSPSSKVNSPSSYLLNLGSGIRSLSKSMNKIPPPEPKFKTLMSQTSGSTSSGRVTSLQFRRHVAHLASPLHPLLSVSTGKPHPAFPKTLLSFHLLTELQLDDLAHFYHQRTPSGLSFEYPAPVVTRWTRDSAIQDKRRRFGRFVGLRGCDSPGVEKSPEEIDVEKWIQERIRDGLKRERELEAWRSKGF